MKKALAEEARRRAEGGSPVDDGEKKGGLFGWLKRGA
jgi:hypothetical protein